MKTANLYTEVTIKVKIDSTIDVNTYNTKDLLEDWIFCHVTDYHAEWIDIEITKDELTDIQD